MFYQAINYISFLGKGNEGERAAGEATYVATSYLDIFDVRKKK
jgi:hypothetical protein